MLEALILKDGHFELLLELSIPLPQLECFLKAERLLAQREAVSDGMLREAPRATPSRTSIAVASPTELSGQGARVEVTKLLVGQGEIGDWGDRGCLHNLSVAS